MGNEDIDLKRLFAIDKKTGKKFEIGMAKLEPGGIKCEEPIIFEEPIESWECAVQIKTIKKKRFIKLLMSKGFQKRDAIKMHEIYKIRYGLRSLIGLELFVATWNTKPEIKVVIGERE